MSEDDADDDDDSDEIMAGSGEVLHLLEEVLGDCW